MIEKDDTEIDLQIVADSFHTVCDASAWSSMVEAWDRKLARAGYGERALETDTPIRRHYAAIDALMRKVGLPTAEDPVEHAVESVEAPALVLSPKLRVAAINPAGQRAFGLAQGQMFSIDAVVAEHRTSFNEIVRRASQRSPASHAILRLQLADERASLAEAFAVVDPQTQGQSIALRTLALQWNAATARVLAEAFGLSAAELEVTRLLFEEHDREAISRERGVSLRTTRAQLASIFAKTETANQVDLVRLVAMVCARMTSRPAARGLHWQDPLERERVLVRPDGRRLAYTWLGAEDGFPALFVPGIVNGYLYPPQFERVLAEGGIRLYVLHRPGAGNSDGDRMVPTLDDHMEAVAFLCRSLALPPLLAVGVHAATIPLVMLAAREPTLFSGVVGIGRFLTYELRHFRKIAPAPRALLWLTINAPWAADIVGKSGYRALLRHGVDWYIERAYGDMPFDFAFAKQAEVAPLLRNACAFTFRQGHEIFFDDLELRKHDIRQALRELTIPFHWMLGNADVYGTARHETGFYSRADIDDVLACSPLASFERIDDAGELSIYQRPALVAERLVALHGIVEQRHADTARR